MWSNQCTTAVSSSTLPSFNPALIAHYVSERTVGTEAVDVIEQTATVINIGFAA